MLKNIREIDGIDKLLLLGIVFFTFVLLALAKWDAQDGQTFQVVSGLLTGFSGAFFARLKPKPEGGVAPNTTGDVTGGTNK